MKCPICGGDTKTSLNEMDGIKFKAHQCTACGEELLDMRQLRALAKKYKRLRQAKEVTFSRWGNSLAVRIPKDVVKDLQIDNGSTGFLIKENGQIRILTQ